MLDDLDDDFVVNTNSEVDASNKYSSYEQLDFAAMACRNDSECVGIYDEGCDGYGPFQLIKKGFIRSHYGSNCVHKKKRFDGRKIFLPTSNMIFLNLQSIQTNISIILQPMTVFVLMST